MQMDEFGDTRLPSQITTGDGWLFVYQKLGDYPRLARGKWLVHTTRERIDNLWQIIALATEEGYLGSFSKVSTAGLQDTAKTGVHVICMYTYDSNDREDIMRIRAALREMNIIQPLSYQTWNANEIVTLYKE
jgi:Domain of unknown function (DUF1917)